MSEGNYEYDDADRQRDLRQDRLTDAVLYLLAVGELPEHDDEDENGLFPIERRMLTEAWEGKHGSRLVDAIYESIGHFMQEAALT